MNGEKTPAPGTTPENGYYTGQETSTGDIGSSGLPYKILHAATLISVLVAFGCTISGSVQAESAIFFLPFLLTLMWFFIHLALLYFSKKDQHNFSPPAWFVFISSGHIFMQALVVIILTLFKKSI